MREPKLAARRNLPVFRLSGGLLHPRNLLPTGVKITSNKNHRRLLPLRELRSSTKSLLGLRLEPSLLSNQSFRSSQGWGLVLALPRARALAPLTPTRSRAPGVFDFAFFFFVLLPPPHRSTRPIAVHPSNHPVPCLLLNLSVPICYPLSCLPSAKPFPAPGSRLLMLFRLRAAH